MQGNGTKAGHLLAVTLAVLAGIAVPGGEALAKNSFLVAPGRIDLDLSRPVTRSFIITNNGDGPIRVVVEPIYFQIDSKSLAAGAPLYPDRRGEDDLTKFIRVSPRTLSLRPGQRRDVRVSVRPPASLLEGDYRAHLLVKMLESAGTVGTPPEQEEQTGITMRLDIKLETAAAIYAHKGERQPDIEVGCTSGKDKALLLDVTNPTKWRFEGTVKGYPYTAPKEGKEDAIPTVSGEPLFQVMVNALRESRRTVHTPYQPAGNSPLTLIWEATNVKGVSGHAVCLSEE